VSLETNPLSVYRENHDHEFKYIKVESEAVKEILNSIELKIGVGIIFYEAYEELERTIRSLLPYRLPNDHITNTRTVDYIFLIDGSFGYNGSKLSSPETVSKIQSLAQWAKRIYNVEIIYIDDQAGETEYSKRQRYLELCAAYKCNVLMIIDSDEYIFQDDKLEITTNWKQFREEVLEAFVLNHNVFSIQCVFTEYGQMSPYPRVWIRPEQMTYYNLSHYKFINFTEKDEHKKSFQQYFQTQGSYKTLKGITLKHDHNLRTNEHFEHRESYRNYISQYEKILEDRTIPVKDSDEIAKEVVKEGFKLKGQCFCKRCVKLAGIDPKTIFDARPKEKRTWNPYDD
jgi:hypothetical protein